MSHTEQQKYYEYIEEMKDYCNQETDCNDCPFHNTEMCNALKNWSK